MAELGSDDEDVVVDMRPGIDDEVSPAPFESYNQDDLGLGDEDEDEDLEDIPGGGGGGDDDVALGAGGALDGRQMTRDVRDPERRFCPQCGNMWQPREERTTQTLMLTCRNCGYEEPAHTGKVYENRIKKEVTTRLDAINPEVVHGAKTDYRGRTSTRVFEKGSADEFGI